MLTQFLPMLFTILIVVDPLSLVPLYISLTNGMSNAEKHKTIRTSVLVAFVVLSVFIVFGPIILNFFGISPGAFYIAGGLLFFLISIDMLFGQMTRAKPQESDDPAERTSVAIFPLAIPMLSGPGAITTIMLFTSQGGSNQWLTMGMMFVAVIITLTIAFISMHASKILLRILGKTGVSVIERMMGLLVSGLAIEFVYKGLLALNIVSKVAK